MTFKFKKLKKWYGYLKLALASITIRPLSHIWPKDPNLIAFMPREGSRYIDNVAHMYEQLRIQGLLPSGAYLLVTTQSKTARAWRKKGRQAKFYIPRRPGILLRYLRTSVVITDSWQWVKGYRYACFAGAKKVQIWHGIPLKKIERSNLQGRTKKGMARGWELTHQWMRGRYPRYDLLVSTSDFFAEHAFSPSFLADKVVNTGYPRNDYSFSKPDERPDVSKDEKIIQLIKSQKKRGKRIVVYTPTFRDRSGGPFSGTVPNLFELKEFAVANDIVFVVKLHPYVTYKIPNYMWPDVVSYRPSADAAPLMDLSDLLVTDYSSIYFDYLLLDKPIVFFAYDYEKYTSVDRGFLFDYDEYTPGPKCFDEESLFRTLVSELSDPDAEWATRREALKDKSFEHQDGQASLRIWREVQALQLEA
jgi:CDP-glycerol glycerophosphotransferase